ncbi:MAG TPA: DUF1559 domain-containing protein [Lacipirellulaceae bacterium]|nr:DUF1559 domain-containing protein [Lacipirellulaceae bacterium]
MAIASRRRFAFTLVELLVVIAIIGTLVALLLPAVPNARARARQLSCLNNVKQIAIAMMNYDSSKGQLPGYTQFIKRGSLDYASIYYDGGARQFGVESKVFPSAPTTSQLKDVSAFSWATMLLSRLERQDIWDAIVQPPVVQPPVPQGKVPVPPIAIFVCPSDRDVASQPDLAGLTYIANCGAWDRDTGGNFIPPPNGDTIDNGVFFSNADFARAGATAPIPRISGIKDGSGTTLMFSENIHKSYDPVDASGAPAFGWLFGSEQQLGMVWVDPNNNSTSPKQPVGVSVNDQEAINRDTNASGPVNYPSNIPRYARPASGHANGVNVAFCDGHGMFLRDDIDYLVYQQLMTPNGRKCVDPVDPSMNLNSGQSIYLFRAAPPLAEKDYQ